MNYDSYKRTVMKLLELICFPFLWIMKVKHIYLDSSNDAPFFYHQSIDCVESLLTDNCCEWHAGVKDGSYYYRVFKKGINKLKAEPDDIFYDTYVYRGNTAEEALLKAVKALSTKSDFKNKRNFNYAERL